MNNDFVPVRTTNINKTPEATPSRPVSAEETVDAIKNLSLKQDGTVNEKGTKIKKPRKSPVRWFKDLNKKQKIIFILVTLLIISGGVVGTVLALRKTTKPVPVAKVEPPAPVPPPAPTTEASHLTGVQVKPELNKRPVTAIMIENSPDARPQSGLIDSGVVFEAIAEGGITRFLTLHQEDQPAYIGPVRSVRPYYVDWLHGFDAAVAHVGGSADGLAKIKAEGIKDLDQFANADAYWRINERYAPHNMYTSIAKLDVVSNRKGYTSSTFDSWPRKADKPSATPTAKTLDFAISGFLYNAHFDYDAATNTYKRSEGGKPHVDEKSGTQIAPKVVIAAVMGYGIAANGVNSRYDNIGSGKCFVFQDGDVTEGTWTKASGKEQISFKDATGTPVKLNAGQTWVTAVGTVSGVVYKP